MPTTRTPSPISTAAVISIAWTTKNDVGPLDHAAPSQARSSLTIATAKRGQISTLKTPAAIRNRAAFLEIT